MSPYERARFLYQRFPQERSFTWYWDWHCQYAFAYATQEFCIMGRPIIREVGPLVNRCLFLADRSQADCWYIHAMAGNLSKAWDILPYPLGWMGFERMRGGTLELTYVLTEQLRRLCVSDPNALEAPILSKA